MNDTDMPEARQSIEQELLFSGEETGSWINALHAAVNRLIVHDFPKLVAVLYRLDVSEKKLKQVLQAKPQTDAAEIIALLIVERVLQKIKTRRQFRQDGGDITAGEY